MLLGNVESGRTERSIMTAVSSVSYLPSLSPGFSSVFVLGKTPTSEKKKRKTSCSDIEDIDECQTKTLSRDQDGPPVEVIA